MLGKARTLNPQIRSLILYPFELQALGVNTFLFFLLTLVFFPPPSPRVPFLCHYILFALKTSTCVARCSLLVARCSLLVARCSLLFTVKKLGEKTKRKPLSKGYVRERKTAEKGVRTLNLCVGNATLYH